jgi:iron complex outermembrane recepter protein
MRTFFVACVARALLLVGVLGFPVPAAAQAGSITGVVLIGEATVNDADVVIPALGRRVRADAAGRFAFDEVPAGTYLVEAESARWGRRVTSVQVRDGATVELTLSLEAVFHLDEMIVSAGGAAMRRSEAYQAASVVTSRDLLARGQASLGESLSHVPGVSSTYFGPGASRPLIRGIGGDRVRVLEAGIGLGDASSTSPDHAVGVEARSADRIEIIRGPATLLYGSSAVGGVVNVLDQKIVREPPTATLTGYLEGLGGSVANERTASGALALRQGPLVATASGLWRDASDYAIPGFAEADPEPGEVATGVLANSALESRRGSAGVTLIGPRGYVGVAFSVQRSDYGVPVEHAEDPSLPSPGEEEPITIDLHQDRVDFEGALRFAGGPFRTLKARLGLADYQHVELEGEEVGTRFFNDYFEARVESDHSFNARTQGSWGAQLSLRDFEAVGDEAFVPPSETRSFALFAHEELRATDRVRIQGGLRYERQSAEATTAGAKRTDDAFSASVGLNVDASDPLTLSVSVSRSVKLPNTEELFSNGPHAATQAFEIGNADLGREAALGVDVTAHVHAERVRGSASFFVTGFSDYIHEVATGNRQDGLDEYVFVQGDARFAGFEVEGEVDVVEGDPSANAPHVAIEVMGDLVRAELTESEERLPRIPAARLGAGVNYRQGRFVVRGFARRTLEQDRVGPFETPTPGFTMVDASISYRVFTGNRFHDVTLVVNNLTDTEARLHTSFLKDVAPLPGREIRLVYRLNF